MSAQPHKHATEQDKRSERRVRGSVLAEFALLSFVIWLLLAGILEIGRALTAQQLLQHAARTIGREMARLPLPANATFETAVASSAFRSNVLDDRFLVVDSDLLARCGVPDFGQAGHQAGLDALFWERPVGNRLLRPLMIFDVRGDEQMMRYPGALLTRNTPPGPACGEGSRFTVGIAEVNSAADEVTWHPVVENSSSAFVAGTLRRDFALAEGGWVGLRINYPFQSAGLLAAERSPASDPTTGRATQRFVSADRTLSDVNLDALGGEFAPSREDGGVYAGLRGLGRLYSAPDAAGNSRAVRPYRRLLSAQAGFRREIFLPPTTSPTPAPGGAF